MGIAKPARWADVFVYTGAGPDFSRVKLGLDVQHMTIPWPPHDDTALHLTDLQRSMVVATLRAYADQHERALAEQVDPATPGFGSAMDAVRERRDVAAIIERGE